jgi:hypothetical protein
MLLYPEYKKCMGDIYTCATLNTETLQFGSAKLAPFYSLSSQFSG